MEPGNQQNVMCCDVETENTSTRSLSGELPWYKLTCPVPSCKIPPIQGEHGDSGEQQVDAGTGPDFPALYPTSSRWAVVVVLKHLDGFSHKQDLLRHPDGDVRRQHLCAQGELLQRRRQHVLLLDQPLHHNTAGHHEDVTQTEPVTRVRAGPASDWCSHQVLQFSQLFPTQAPQPQVLLLLLLVGRGTSCTRPLLHKELLALVQEQSVQHPGCELLVHHTMADGKNPAVFEKQQRENVSGS